MTTYEKTTLQDVREMLASVDPDCSRHEWIQVGQALKGEYGEEGFAVWNDWSKRGTKYREREIPAQWKSLGRGTGRPVTIATIAYRAKMGGWSRKTSSRSGEPQPQRIISTPSYRPSTAPTPQSNALAELDPSKEAKRVIAAIAALDPSKKAKQLEEIFAVIDAWRATGRLPSEKAELMKQFYAMFAALGPSDIADGINKDEASASEAIDPSEKASRLERAIARSTPSSYKAVARYPYSESFVVVRYNAIAEPPPGKKREKTFRPFSFDGASMEWKSSDPPKPQSHDDSKGGWLPLYNLEEIEKTPIAETILVVEGEKCVEAARSIGLVATTSSHGASADRKTNWEPLRGRSVAILPDPDEDGEKCGQTRVEILRSLGCEIRVIRLKPRRKDETHGTFDIADWIDEDEESESETIAAQLRQIIAETRPAVARGDRSLADDLQGIETELAKTHGRRLLGLASGVFPTLDKHLDGWRGFGVIVAKPGIGKTNLLLQIGRGIVEEDPGAVFVYLTLEMAREEMLLRSLCQATGLHYALMRKGETLEPKGEDGLKLSRSNRETLTNGLAALRATGDRVRFVGRDDLNFENPFRLELTGVVESFMRTKGATKAFVAVDHLSKIPSSKTDPLAQDDERIDLLLRAQRSLGEEVALVVVSESRKSDFDSPRMESVKGSVELTYSPDFILALADASPEEDIGEPKPPRYLTASILKGRAGMTRAKISLAHHWHEQRFEEHGEDFRR